MDREHTENTAAALSRGQLLVAVLLAVLGSVIIWVAIPYNNFRLKNSYLSDTFLPEIVVAFLLLLLLAVNPLLRLIGPRWVLRPRQIALVCSLMLFAAIIPSNGLMRMFPRFVAQMNVDMDLNVTTARVAARTGLPQALFPDPLPTQTSEGEVKTYETPVSDQFLDELDEGKKVPWRAWIAPMASWGMLIMALWAMMLGLGGVVFPQWRERERLPFPLLNVYQALTGGTAEDSSERLLPAVFYNRSFWIGCIVVFVIHAFRGLNTFTNAFPSFPLRWEMRPYFTDSILRFAPQAFNWQIIFFSVVGVAYFIPSRYAISIWGWVFVYSWYLTLGQAYIPAFDQGQVGDQAFGMLLAIAGWTLWLGRAHWARVGRAMLGRGRGDPESRSDAVAGWTFAIGCAGIVLWLRWAGCPWWWSVLAMLGCAIIALIMARVIAETGIPALWTSRVSVQSLSALFPLVWKTPAVLLFTGALYALVTRATAVSAAVMCTLALGIDRMATPRHRTRVLMGGLAILLVGYLLCGAVHLNMGYHSAEVTTTPKTGGTTLNAAPRIAQSEYHFFTTARFHQLAGLGLGTGLLWACARFPAWPIHPVGILFCRISIGSLLWFSVFLGWLAKTAITRLFGAGAYRKARPLFLGLILGELLAVIVWAIVPVVIIWVTGADPAEVPRYTLMQYP